MAFFDCANRVTRDSLTNLVLFSFRYYILRERPSAGSRSDNIMEDIPMNESGEGALLGLPESETDLDVSENGYQVKSSMALIR